VCGVLTDFGRFCTKSETRDIETRRGHAIPSHQAILRDQHVVACVVDILDASYHLWQSVQPILAPTPTTASLGDGVSDTKESKHRGSARDSFLGPLGGVPIVAVIDPEVEQRKKQYVVSLLHCFGSLT
jgi:hypothetical protein